MALANSYWGLIPPSSAGPRILTERRALDSYHNVLFSLLLFWRTQSRRWPSRLTVVSHAFKRRRLVDLHCGAGLLFPLDRVAFVGIDPPADVLGVNGAAAVGVVQGGVTRAEEEWAADPQGVGAALAGKRRRRNPWAVDQRLFEGDAEAQAASGLEVVQSEAGGEGVGEMIKEGSARPWADVVTVA